MDEETSEDVEKSEELVASDDDLRLVVLLALELVEAIISDVVDKTVPDDVDETGAVPKSDDD